LGGISSPTATSELVDNFWDDLAIFGRQMRVFDKARTRILISGHRQFLVATYVWL